MQEGDGERAARKHARFCPPYLYAVNGSIDWFALLILVRCSSLCALLRTNLATAAAGPNSREFSSQKQYLSTVVNP